MIECGVQDNLPVKIILDCRDAVPLLDKVLQKHLDPELYRETIQHVVSDIFTAFYDMAEAENDLLEFNNEFIGMLSGVLDDEPALAEIAEAVVTFGCSMVEIVREHILTDDNKLIHSFCCLAGNDIVLSYDPSFFNKEYHHG